MVKISGLHLHEVKKLDVVDNIKLLAPWFHDIYFPELDTSTQRLAGVDVRLLHAYDVEGFPDGYFKKTPLQYIANKKILEIGPASGFYTIKLAQQGNIVTCIERTGRFVEQLKFLRTYFDLEDKISIVWGEFPSVSPPEKYDVVLCLGVLYHIPDFAPFLSALDSISAPDIYLETHVSKTNKTMKAGTNEGFAFSDTDINECILKNMPNYSLMERTNFSDSENAEYNKLDYYRCLLYLQKKME